MPTFNSPEEFAAYIAEQHDRMHAMQEDAENRAKQFFIEMKPEDLVIFRNLCMEMAGSSMKAAHYVGTANAILEFVHGVCEGCGRDHEAEELELLKEQATAPEAPTQAEPQPESVEQPTQGQTDYTEPWRKVPGRIALTFTLLELEQMKEYNLDDAYDEAEPHRFLGFVCKGCGTRYVSIADRMLKAPDDCHGCHLKSAFG